MCSNQEAIITIINCIHDNFRVKCDAYPFISPQNYAEDCGVFTTHYDWHSSVHAHWSILSACRILQLNSILQPVLDRLNENRLTYERQYILKYPTHELPYGQAWLILLLTELLHHQCSDLMVQTAVQLFHECCERLLNWLFKSDFPDGLNGGCSGTHSSWMFAFTLLNKAFNHAKAYKELTLSHHEGLLAEINKKYIFAYNSDQSIRDECLPSDFLSVEALVHMLNGTCCSHHIYSSLSIMNDGLDTIQLSMGNNLNIVTCHQLGRIITTMWPLAAIIMTNDKVSLHQKEFDEFIKRLMKFDEWKENYIYYSHWIPQFIWFALWLNGGEK